MKIQILLYKCEWSIVNGENRGGGGAGQVGNGIRVTKWGPPTNHRPRVCRRRRLTSTPLSLSSPPQIPPPQKKKKTPPPRARRAPASSTGAGREDDAPPAPPPRRCLRAAARFRRCGRRRRRRGVLLGGAVGGVGRLLRRAAAALLEGHQPDSGARAPPGWVSVRRSDTSRVGWNLKDYCINRCSGLRHCSVFLELQYRDIGSGFGVTVVEYGCWCWLRRSG